MDAQVVDVFLRQTDVFLRHDNNTWLAWELRNMVEI